jgi:nitrate/nitrite transporter NarK
MACKHFYYVSDMFPKKAVGSVTGIGSMAGTLGGMLIAKPPAYYLIITKRSETLKRVTLLSSSSVAPLIWLRG